ncbi:hypothetical protein [Jatrophihabitans lederbergiae]|uniref:Sigma-70 family RNA polymerase sigma factor n=1 Tax=Jatrophihabitans lederbergiae TaxID=3075547 RepID=A0ABU2JFI7_9ACTN|nr:hypothetical protein [Jatrophihabitans sp. DSM 44399]MDT0263759.1 hypothetical protein [Jatrophihabitans sp. DSM 44399]
MTSHHPSTTASTVGSPIHRARHRRPGGVPNSLDIARTSFALLVTEPEPLSLDGRNFDGLPGEGLPLSLVRDLLLAASCPQATRDAVWAELVTRSRREGGAWTVGAVGVALPALTSVAARLTGRFAGDPADIHAEVLTGFLAALAEVDIERPRIMLRLRWAAYRAGHAALTESLDGPAPAAPAFGSLPPVPPWGHPDLVLARAVADGAISRLEADVIGSTRLEDIAVADWATAHGASTWAVYKLRKRAEQHLLTYLLDTEPGRSISPARSRSRGAAPVTAISTRPAERESA